MMHNPTVADIPRDSDIAQIILEPPPTVEALALDPREREVVERVPPRALVPGRPVLERPLRRDERVEDILLCVVCGVCSRG